MHLQKRAILAANARSRFKFDVWRRRGFFGGLSFFAAVPTLYRFSQARNSVLLVGALASGPRFAARIAATITGSY
jgi:hypothetical protein